jgi:hypothetical protein
MEGGGRARTPLRPTTPDRPSAVAGVVPLLQQPHHRRRASGAFVCCTAPTVPAALQAAAPATAGDKDGAPTHHKPGVRGDQQRRRQQLEGQSLSALRRQAAQAGVDSAEVDGALDAECPKTALIEMILERTNAAEWGVERGVNVERSVAPRGAPTAREGDALEVLTTELSSLRLGSLQKRAVAEGVAAEALEAALDDLHPQRATINLIVNAVRQASAIGTYPEAAAASRRQELWGALANLTMAALLKRARAAGIDQETLDDTQDAESPRDALIALLVTAELQAHAADGAAEARLREELVGLRIAALLKRARAAGIDQETLDDTQDAESPRDALIALLVAAELQAHAADGAAEARLREELVGLRMAALLKRARAAGIDQETLDDTQDAESPRDALIALLVEAQSGADAVASHSTAQPVPVATRGAAAVPALAAAATPVSPGGNRSHFGVRKPAQQPAATTRTPRVALLNGKHVMLSYQWDHQSIVTQVRKALQARGLPVWMDVAGGMGADVFDSMAQGVQGAAVVIAFMSRKYQASQNCKLELKFARQTGTPIVPVKLEQDWNASDWLGIITAGALWTPLYGPVGADFEQSVTSLVEQVRRVAGAGGAEGFSMEGAATTMPGADDGDEFSVAEMREELERLRAESGEARRAPPTAKGRDGQAIIPATVPEVPEGGLMVSGAMHALVDMVVSPASKRLCGFFGMGGVGKTTTSAWLVRQEVVRSRFEVICWVSLGQTPNLAAQQQLLYAQLTSSRSLATDLSAGEKLQAIRMAFAGRTCLLVLDDVWESGHIAFFDEVDVATQSKVLLSSRVRGILSGCDIVDMGLPSEADAVQIVMSAAGVSVDAHTPAPAEAREVVALCKRLPLTLGMAGRMARDLGLQHDWSEVAVMMREELSAHGEARTVEDSVIATSLGAIQGPYAAAARALFRSFRLVPEDAKVPLEALQWIYQADMGDGDGVAGVDALQAPTLLQLRKCTKLLIDRCLVLGPIDQPSLHDIVVRGVPLSRPVSLHGDSPL